MALLERQGEIAALRGALDRARAGRGSLTLVTGEAGIGKTVLVQHVMAAFDDETRVLVGSCDALSTPRALGALRDIAAAAGGELGRLVESDAPRPK